MEDTFNDPEEWLKCHSELLQKTRTLWHSGMDPASDECRQLRVHVQELERSGLIFTHLPFPVNLEYKQKAGLVLVSSGSLAVLCDISVQGLALTRETSNAVESKIDIIFLEELIFNIARLTDHDAAVCKAVQDHKTLVPALLTRLEEYMAGTLQNDQDDIIRNALNIVHNVALFEENVQYLRGLPNVLRVLQSYTTGTTKRGQRLVALTTMAELVSEEAEEVNMLAMDTEMACYTLDELEKALKSENAYSLDGWEVTELIRAIVILTKNKDNQLLLVKEDVLSCLEKVLKHCTSYARKDCQRCLESTRALLNLITSEQHKDKIMENKGLLDSVVIIYRDKAKTHSNDCFDTVEKVLSSLREKLQAHQKYKRIGHCLIINNRDFSSDFPTTRPLKTRRGTDVDKDKLTKLFEGMQFKVTCQNNASDSEMKQQLQATAHMDHSRYDVFVCCVLSHGDTGYVYGANGVPVEMRDLMTPFQADSCRTLAGKPKLFFIQACQGRDGERGHETMETDVVLEETRPGAIPNEADFLLGHSTVPGYVSYRHVREGSWYISTLCDVLDIHYETRDILDILTMVNKGVSEKMGDERQQQVPAPMYTLKKKLIFGE